MSLPTTPPIVNGYRRSGLARNRRILRVDTPEASNRAAGVGRSWWALAGAGAGRFFKIFGPLILNISEASSKCLTSITMVMRKLYPLSTEQGLAAFKDIVTKLKQSNQSEMTATPKAEIEPSASQDPRTTFINQMMERFDAADSDRDGEITFSEFIRHEWSRNECLDPHSRGAKATQATDLKVLRREFHKLDLDGNGKISEEEFRAMVARFYDEPPARDSSD
eukprot:maker-scaffold161_size295871-snap-gene-1.35 protein:Tk05112 transcript:maker-scaffold161_size295871-snap-gene-1.35-mRNA-1 annotation:"polcalcin jun"